jgi:hypothetical protein
MLKENRSDRVPKGISKRVIQLISLFINMRSYNINSGNRITCRLPLHLIPCVIGRRGTASKTRRPSEIGITIIPALNISSVIHASTSKSTIRSTKPYLKDGKKVR